MRQRECIKQSTISTKDQTKGIKYKKIKDQVNHSFTTYKKDYCNRNYNSNFETNIGKFKATWNGINSILSRMKNKTQVPK